MVLKASSQGLSRKSTFKISVPVPETLNLKISNSNKQLTSVMEIVPSYPGCEGRLAAKKGFLLAGMSSEASLQAVEAEEVVESVSA